MNRRHRVLYILFFLLLKNNHLNYDRLRKLVAFFPWIERGEAWFNGTKDTLLYFFSVLFFYHILHFFLISIFFFCYRHFFVFQYFTKYTLFLHVQTSSLPVSYFCRFIPLASLIAVVSFDFIQLTNGPR